MLLRRTPRPGLRSFVKVLWATDMANEARGSGTRELVLPTGTAHLAFRFGGCPLHIYDAKDAEAPRLVGDAVVGGPRATYYVRRTSEDGRSVGAQLYPGALALLTGAPADELAGRHTPLDGLWGSAAQEARARLAEAEGPEQALDVLEALLMARLPGVRGKNPIVIHALERFSRIDDVGQVVHESGYSHRRFIAIFREAVGLAPRDYCRVLRLQRTLELCVRSPTLSLSDIARRAGFGDQPHLCRDFRELVGVTPAQYRKLRPHQPNHVPLLPSVDTSP